LKCICFQISPNLLENLLSVSTHVVKAFKVIDDQSNQYQADLADSSDPKPVDPAVPQPVDPKPVQPLPSPSPSAEELERLKQEEKRKRQKEIRIRQEIVKTVTSLAKKVVLANSSKPVLEIETDTIKLQVLSFNCFLNVTGT